MYYLIGTDEAGYGPNLGPLAVTATLWKIEDDVLAPDALYSVLEPVISASAGKKVAIPIADSKKLHKHENLQPLEMGIFAALEALKHVGSVDLSKKYAECDCFINAQNPLNFPISSVELCDFFCGSETAPLRAAVPWHSAETEEILPKNLPCERVSELGVLFLRTLSEHGITLLGIRSALIFPAEFNTEVEACGSKGVFLSDTTMRLIVYFWEEVQKRSITQEKTAENEPKNVLENTTKKVLGNIAGNATENVTGNVVENVTKMEVEPPEVRVFCDKHGGRNFYLPTLMDFFPNLPFCVVEEGRNFSEYIHYGSQNALRIRFQAKGETLLPVALASMVSKYLREVSMSRFNRWWEREIPGIRPTAGYPLDAKRFRAEISEKMEEMKLNWSEVWRNR
ncbi:MAG: hypothetical protein Q4C70_09470 [Planctomycetia bacterium]|nr:hypothetical protein [Planctomycetia bacterium]